MILIKFLSRLPLPILYILAFKIYALVYYVHGYRRKVILENVRNAFPHKTEREHWLITKQFYKNLSQVFVESIRARHMSDAKLKRRIRISNPELIEKYTSQGRSVIAMTGHIYNWEWALLGCCLHLDLPIDFVYKRLRDSTFEKFMTGTRSRFGGTPIEMRDAMNTIIGQKNEVRGYGFVGDQSPTKDEIEHWTSFLNQETAFYTGAAKIVKETNFAVVYLNVKRVKRGYYVITFEELSEKVDQPGTTQLIDKYANRLEEHIKQSPADWLWSHRRWKHKRETSSSHV